MTKIAGKMRDDEMKQAATTMQKQMKTQAEDLSKLLAQLAVQIATKEGQAASAGSR
jgi:hypothetical protein